jgi:hypothetical protein
MNTMLAVKLIVKRLVKRLDSVCGMKLVRLVLTQELIGLTRWQERKRTQDAGCLIMNRVTVTRVT